MNLSRESNSFTNIYTDLARNCCKEEEVGRITLLLQKLQPRFLHNLNVRHHSQFPILLQTVANHSCGHQMDSERPKA